MLREENSEIVADLPIVFHAFKMQPESRDWSIIDYYLRMKTPVMIVDNHDSKIWNTINLPDSPFASPTKRGIDTSSPLSPSRPPPLFRALHLHWCPLQLKHQHPFLLVKTTWLHLHYCPRRPHWKWLLTIHVCFKCPGSSLVKEHYKCSCQRQLLCAVVNTNDPICVTPAEETATYSGPVALVPTYMPTYVPVPFPFWPTNLTANGAKANPHTFKEPSQL
ncbi:hypothetical protein Sjap_004222 [Stephania japonica]|uniref:Uncharacterized protein n=1 Tax=Stephania japonica TaxID=461633 RepID=A0AAP0K2P5_9MAGN